MSIFISKQLKYFMVTMEKKNISKAADELYLTRTPLCKKLADLENVLGKSLFIKKYNELIPTEYAISLHKELEPVYKAQLNIESKLKNNVENRFIIIIFDITIPEFMYRILSSSIESEFTQFTIKFQRTVIIENYHVDNIYMNSTIFISLRPLVLCYSFEEMKWHGGEVTLLMPKSEMEATDKIDIYMWNDNFSEHFKNKIESVLHDKYRTVNYILHNFDFSTILHKIYRGKGACMLPLKTALVYKSDSMGIKPIKNTHLAVYMYHSKNLFKESAKQTKQILLSLI